MYFKILLSRLMPFNSKVLGERMLGLTPLFHVFGNGRLNSAIYAGSTYITLEKFEIDKVVDLIRTHRPTIFPGVPTMYIALLNHPDLTADDLCCFKYCSCGSAPLPIEIIQQFEKITGYNIRRIRDVGNFPHYTP